MDTGGGRFGHRPHYDRPVTSLLDRRALSEAFSATGWGQVRILDTCGSTNAELARLARAGAPHGTVLVTPDQTAGRGRFDRSWVAPADTALAISVLVRPSSGLASWGWLSLLVGIAVVDGLRAATGLDASLKWPNDVLVGERKVCGILSEAVTSDAGPAAVLGMGINVAMTADQLPVPTATSLRLEGSDAAGEAVALAILGALKQRYETWDGGGSLRKAYRDRCDTLGRRVRVHLPDGPVEGVAEDVDASGCLVVSTPRGPRAFAAGDVVHLRPGE